jgi:hypothetical protein
MPPQTISGPSRSLTLSVVEDLEMVVGEWRAQNVFAQSQRAALPHKSRLCRVSITVPWAAGSSVP